VLKTVVLPNIFVETVIKKKVRILNLNRIKREFEHLFKIKIFLILRK